MPCLLTLTLLCRSPPFPLPLSPRISCHFWVFYIFRAAPFQVRKFLQTALKIIMFLQPENVQSQYKHTHIYYIQYVDRLYSCVCVCVCMSEMTTQSQVAEIFTTFLSATETKTYEKCYENVALRLANPAPIYLPIPPTSSHLVTSRTSRQPYTNPNPQ